MITCPICKHPLEVTKYRCEECQVQYEGRFVLPRLARLDKEQSALAEALILHGGNLKEMSEALAISYPTLKKRLVLLSEALKKMKEEDESMIEAILNEIEAGKMKAEEGIRLIREIRHEL